MVNWETDTKFTTPLPSVPPVYISQSIHEAEFSIVEYRTAITDATTSSVIASPEYVHCHLYNTGDPGL